MFFTLRIIKKKIITFIWETQVQILIRDRILLTNLDYREPYFIQWIYHKELDFPPRLDPTQLL